MPRKPTKPAQKRAEPPHESATEKKPNHSPMKLPPRQPGIRPTTRGERVKLPECGALNRQGQPCKNAAGKGTSHPGEGRCKLHGGVGQVKGTRYEGLQARPRLSELIERFAADNAPDDLSHELVLLRALVVDYVERYDDLSAALLAWHASFNRDFIARMKLWRAQVAEYVEEAEQQGGEPGRKFPEPPQPEDFAEKPRQLIDITAAAGLIGQIGSMSDRIHKRQQTGSITMSRLAVILEDLAVELVNACEEVSIRDHDRARLLESVDRRWRDSRSIPRDALMASAGVQEGGRVTN